MNLQPILTGPNVILRPLTNEDFEALYSVASDPLIWEQHFEANRYRREVFQKFFNEAMVSKGAFLILDRASGAIIGSSRYYDYRPDLNDLSIGYSFLSRPYWGGSTNREVKKLMLQHAYRFVEKVYFHVRQNNERSKGAMKKIGGQIVDQQAVTGPNGEEDINLVFLVDRKTAESL